MEKDRRSPRVQTSRNLGGATKREPRRDLSINEDQDHCLDETRGGHWGGYDGPASTSFARARPIRLSSHGSVRVSTRSVGQGGRGAGARVAEAKREKGRWRQAGIRYIIDFRTPAGPMRARLTDLWGPIRALVLRTNTAAHLVYCVLHLLRTMARVDAERVRLTTWAEVVRRYRVAGYGDGRQ